MPELPEVENVRRALEREISGRRLLNVTVREHRLRQKIDIARLEKLTRDHEVLGVRRRGKYLLLDLTSATVLLVHLGMSGSLRLVDAHAPTARHDHVSWQLDDGRTLSFNDPRRFGMIDAFLRRQEPDHPALRSLGVEPLGTGFTAQSLFHSTRGLRRPIKTWLMDGTRIVGIGNIYACEALFGAKIHPATAAAQLSLDTCRRLVRSARATLRAAIVKGGTTFRDFVNTDGSKGRFATHLRVYGREGHNCTRCDDTIRRIVQCGRSTYYCPSCQRA